jgi:dipeptidyl aminopeptidase/acylaminoacyl peptidase
MRDNGTAMTNQAAGTQGMYESGSAAGVEGGRPPSNRTEEQGGFSPQMPAEQAQPPALPQVPYGAWPSPITAAQVAGSRLKIALPTVVGQCVWWQEDQPADAGRRTVVRRGSDGVTRMMLPAPWSARTRVHEYGGLSYLPVPSDVAVATLAKAGAKGGETDPPIVFTHFGDQRMYLAGQAVADGSGQPVPLTPEPPTSEPLGLRYADFVLSPDGREVWCVRERHSAGKVRRAIVAVPLDGAAAENADAVRELVTGSDFFAFPTPSPDGKWLAWICWNHPHMPWDGTELRVAPVADGMPGKGRLIKGSNRESVLAPLWRDNSSLYVATDWTGWWNIYQLGLSGEPPQALYPADEEFAGALWELGARPFALLGDGRLAVRHGRGGATLGLLDPETSELTDLDLPFNEILIGVAASGSVIACVAGAPLEPDSLVKVDIASGEYTVLRTELSELPDRRYLPIPAQVELEGPYGRVVHALVYPPSNPEVTAPAGERPPYIVWVHGGPTAHVTARLSLEKAYFTSRGIGIIDVNYGGSTGYGRLYRNRLNREWGIVDVADAKEAARSLAKAGHADEARLGIRGGSAGGWTALAAVTTGAVHDPVFNAAVAYYGVADLRKFSEHTHDFESRYLDGLIGPLPGFDTVYAERAPLGHVNKNTCPVLLLQGLDDPVVPPEQSEVIAADLAAHGIKHAYIAFEGESHGFRRADSMITSLEAELSFYGQLFGFKPRNVPVLKLSESN